MLKLTGKAGSHHVLRRQQGQKTEEADANPRQEPKRCSEETGAHPRRLSELGGFGKSGPGSLVRGSWWRLSSVFPSGSRPAVTRVALLRCGRPGRRWWSGCHRLVSALPGSRTERCRSRRTGRSRNSIMPVPSPLLRARTLSFFQHLNGGPLPSRFVSPGIGAFGSKLGSVDFVTRR
jgi:hypothetical protein